MKRSEPRESNGDQKEIEAAQSVFEQFLLSSPYMNTSSNDGSLKLKNTFIEVEERDNFVPTWSAGRSSTAPADISDEIYQLARTITKDLPLMATIVEGLQTSNFDLSGLNSSSSPIGVRNAFSNGGGTTTPRYSITTPTAIGSGDVGIMMGSSHRKLSSSIAAAAPVVIPEDADMTNDKNYSTVMLRNIPNKYTQTSLIEAIDSQGFRGLYNFFYLPVDFKNGCNMGYAFINFVNYDSASMFMSVFKGYQLPAKSSKVCDVCWARVQGFKANIEHYRNSPVNDLPDPEYRPLMFQDGIEVAFPRPDPGVRRSAVRRREAVAVADQAFGGSLSRTSTHSSNGGGVPSAFAESDAAVKLFIGGLSAETRDEDIRNHFSKFGQLADAAVVIDKKTGLSRGFAFCSFRDKEAADKVMSTRQHIINGQSVGVRFYQQGK